MTNLGKRLRCSAEMSSRREPAFCARSKRPGRQTVTVAQEGTHAQRRDAMSYKDVVVLFTESRGATARLNAAVEALRRDGAHLIGLYVMPVDHAAPRAACPMPGSETEIRALELIATQTRRATSRAPQRRSRRHSRDAAARAGIACEWRLVEGDAVEYRDPPCAPRGHCHSRAARSRSFAERTPSLSDRSPCFSARAARSSWCPMSGASTRIGRPMFAAWNATREAARAVNDAMPILAKAENVIVLSVNPPDKASGGPAVPGADIALHLARHGVKTEVSAPDTSAATSMRETPSCRAPRISAPTSS